MPLLVVAATARELEAALEVTWDAPQGAVAPVTAYGREVLACVCGIGVINAGLSLGAALARSQAEGVLNLGVAGSFDLSAHPLGSVRLMNREVWPEFGLLASGWCSADASALGFALGRVRRPQAGACGEVWDCVTWDVPGALERLGLNPGPWTTAKSLTVSGVTADAERAEHLRERHQAGLENMEGFALAYGCAVAGLPFLELRSVSNAVGSRPPKAWDLPGALVALGRETRRLFEPGGGA